MTNIDPTIPAAPPPTAPPVPEPTGPVDWEARYRAEVQDRIKEREKYKPFAQTVDALDASSRQAILDLASAAAAGDVDAIKEWTASTYRNLTGSEVASMIAQQQNSLGTPAPTAPAAQPPAPATPPSQTGLTPEQVSEMVQREFAKAELVRQINTELATAGYPANTAEGQAIIQYAQQTRLPIADAVAWYNQQLEQRFQAMAAARSGAAGATPPPAPNGAPAAPISGATPAQRAVARLQAAQQQA